MKVFNGFRLLKRAFVLTHREIMASLVILLAATLVLSTIMWLAERNNEGYEIFDALVWVIVKYVDDPADVAQGPVTLLGQTIGTLVGVLGVAIFAVPAGLVGSGLLDAITEEKTEETTAKNSVKLHKRFRTFPHIKMKTGMTEDELIAAVNNCPDMRLMNIAAAQSDTSMLNDDLVVVNFPLNTEYGCFIDRKSDVTIVAPAALTELGTGSFAYSLAAVDGFNYVSRELTPNQDDTFGFYQMRDSQLDLISESDEKQKMKSEARNIVTCLDNNRILKSVMKSNIICRMGGGTECNTITLMGAYNILVHHSSHLLIIKDIADTIKAYIEPDKEVPAEAMNSYLTEGDGFADAFGETKIFESEPENLKRMIRTMSKETLERFEGKTNI